MAAATSQPEYVTSNIEDLRVGDTVLAFNPGTGQTEPRRIVDAFDRTTYRLRVLEIHDLDGTSQTIRTTDEHPFWVVDQQDFKPAGELEVGEELLGPRGEVQTLASTWAEEHPEGVTVYNFEVEGAHTYFVCASDLSETPVLVQNATAGACPIFRFRDPISKISLRGKSLKAGRKRLLSSGLKERIKRDTGRHIFVDDVGRTRAAYDTISQQGKDAGHWHKWGVTDKGQRYPINNAGRVVDKDSTAANIPSKP